MKVLVYGFFLILRHYCVDQFSKVWYADLFEVRGKYPGNLGYISVMSTLKFTHFLS
jgi:hypothetical protein